MTAKRKINFVVTDLDDTIWDWVNMWHSSFEPYLKRISVEFNVDENILKNEFKKIHQKYGSSEFSFIYQELDCLTFAQKEQFQKENGVKKSIIHEYNSLKKNNLSLYEGVIESLKKIKSSGALIIGFTESNAFFTKYRIKHLEMDGILDYIYAPVDMGVPETVYKHYPEDFWQPEITEMRYLSKDVVKPRPDILEIILRDFSADKNSAIYIGDKLHKDIYMANEASVLSVYAKYGHQIETEQYKLLVDVTHWKDEDVTREREFKANHSLNPIANYTLEKSFNEISNHFEFFQYEHRIDRKITPEIIKIWEKVIDVQQHFNDIALRIRNIAVTAFTFIVGGIGYIEIAGLSFSIGNFELPLSTALAGFGIIVLLAFFYMDRFWYHKLLLGAVKQGILIEKRWLKILPELKLTHAIGESSPHTFFGFKIHSKDKFWFFYGLLCGSLIILGISLFCIHNFF
jgi:phosphoglycolate phosphatase-like HAD superfamily hydrolase